MYNGPTRCRPWPARAGPCRHAAGRIGPRAAPDRASTVPGPRPRPMARSVGHFVGPRATWATLHRATAQPGTNIFSDFDFSHNVTSNIVKNLMFSQSKNSTQI
jgi:hypothetical protein